MTKLSRQNWTRIARNVAKAQSKIANDLLDVAEAEGTGEVAGPQEVVDAIEVIVDQLEEVQAAELVEQELTLFKIQAKTERIGHG